MKLVPDYFVFVSTFHATKLTIRNWNIPTPIDFMESLTQEKDKLVMMGTIKPSKYQALVVGYSNMDSKGNKKYNPKKPPNQNKDKSKSHEEYSSSKKNSQKKKCKGEMSKCTCCSNGFHRERY